MPFPSPSLPVMRLAYHAPSSWFAWVAFFSVYRSKLPSRGDDGAVLLYSALMIAMLNGPRYYKVLSVKCEDQV